MSCNCQEAATTAYRQLREKGHLHEDALKAVENIIRLRHSDYSPATIKSLAVAWVQGAHH
ncbi:hypothetical protein [Aestuariispira ectoiniformans]|uniref:hypothetical protein n=1 Tax=Aestuariispira ectoiniformans TaxID=2775080 RepID=UPI00223B630C|nr:hypothetical protein [Aestuariispira ectoiniformans]